MVTKLLFFLMSLSTIFNEIWKSGHWSKLSSRRYGEIHDMKTLDYLLFYCKCLDIIGLENNKNKQMKDDL